MEDFEIYRKAEANLEKIGRIAPQSELPNLLRGRIAASALRNDKRIQDPAWGVLAEMTLFSNPEMPALFEDAEMFRFGMLDAQLCLMKDAERFQHNVQIIREDYPFFYENQRDFMERALSEERDAFFEQTKRQFSKLEYKYSGSHFFERYPEERPIRVRGTRIHDGEHPFIRDGKKIGRNAPCPCGSGKKFKRCCMGKGIYD